MSPRLATQAAGREPRAAFRVGVARRPATIDRLLAGCLLLLILAGSLTVYSASSHYGMLAGSPWLYFFSHLKKVAVGVAAFVVTMRIDYRVWKKAAGPAALVGTALLALTLLQPEVNSARRWLFVGGAAFQPIDLVKFALIAQLASALSGLRDFRRELSRLLPTALLWCVALAVLVLQPNFSMVLALGAVATILVFLGGVPLSWLAAGGLSVGAAGAALMFAESYRANRVLHWLSAALAPGAADGQLAQSYIALARGGLSGQGAGQSVQKLFYLPEPFNDFIFSIFGEEWGFVGCAVVVLLYALVFLRGLNIVHRAHDEFARLLAAGIVSLFFVHTAINLCVTTGLIPTTGQPLPLFSYGGSAMVTMLGALGVLMNIAYQSRSLDPGKP